MLDLHVHVLPGIDDGPRTLEDALALARALVADGIEHVVATPHIYPGVFDNTPQRITDAFERLQSAIEADRLPLTMTWAAEVRICPEILDWLEQRRLPLLDGSLVGPSTALIELPDGQIPVGTDRLMALLIDRGITPLIAHPERNKAVMEQPARLEALRRIGCCFQLTAGSVLGEFGSRAQVTARHLLDADWVDVIASDAHNLAGRKPRMSAARQWIEQSYDAALAERLMVSTPQKIAGVSSFSVESAGQKLVFRDLPARKEAEDEEWRNGLDLLDTQPPTISRATLSPASTFDEAEHGAWSLTDFRVDVVIDGLNEALRQAGASPGGDSLFEIRPAQAPATERSSVDEDWNLPTFGISAPKPAEATPAPAPAPQRATIATTTVTVEPATATVITLPQQPRAEVVAVAAQAPVSALTAHQGKPGTEPVVVAVIASPAARPTPQAQENRGGLRLSDIEPLAPRVIPRNARDTTAASAPAGVRRNTETSTAEMARRGMATTSPFRQIELTAQPEKTPRPVHPPVLSDGSTTGFRLSNLPFLSSNGKR